MPALDVLGCIAAVVSTFHTAAETIETIKDRKDKKKKKKERDIEELIEIKLMHKSLVEGATQCRTCCENRHKRYGPAFDVGDATATSALKDIVISLQSEVIQALQIAKAVESAVLDVSTIHESSITNRRDAIRAMDELCQRITRRMPRQSQYNEDPYNRRTQNSPASPPPPPEYTTLRRMASDDSDSFPMFPGTISLPGQSNAEFRAFQRMQPSRQPSSAMSQREAYRATYASAFSWQDGPDSGRPSYDLRTLPFRQPRVQEESDEDGRKHQDFPEMDRLSQWSIQDSALGSDAGSKHLIAGSLASMTDSDRHRASSVSEHSAISQNQEEKQDVKKRSNFGKRSTSLTSKALPPKPIDDDEDENNLTPGSETSSVSSRTAGAALSVTSRSTRSEARDDASRVETVASIASRSPRVSHSRGSPSRAEYAPEVVTKEFESMLALKSNRAPTIKKQPASINSRSTIRKPYNYVESLDGPELDLPWLPLPRPARHNNYHGFCKGAWQIRKSMQEGLSVKMIPNESGSIMVPHWCCKLCDFRSKALNQNALPDQIYFNKKCGVRYRWLFMAKCHTAAVGTYIKPENYSYGCMFCAAEGRTTVTHEKLDNLMLHIFSKHKTSMMTPETKERTKCIVGGAADRTEEWDVNLPLTRPKGPGGPVGEFMMSAMSGISKYSELR